MTVDEMMFWNEYPEMFPIYEVLSERLTAAYPDVKIKISKTQISFYNRHMFAMASTSKKRKKEWPKEFVMVSIGLPYHLVNPRVLAAVEAYPGRWTHHIAVKEILELDEELFLWIDEAYQFAQSK
jgi:hypothetical protein